MLALLSSDSSQDGWTGSNTRVPRIRYDVSVPIHFLVFICNSDISVDDSPRSLHFVAFVSISILNYSTCARRRLPPVDIQSLPLDSKKGKSSGRGGTFWPVCIDNGTFKRRAFMSGGDDSYQSKG